MLGPVSVLWLGVVVRLRVLVMLVVVGLLDWVDSAWSRFARVLGWVLSLSGQLGGVGGVVGVLGDLDGLDGEVRMGVVGVGHGE